MNRVKVAVVGANGYIGEELCVLLARHNGVEVTAVSSRQHAGAPLSAVLPRLEGSRIGELEFISSEVDALLGSGAEIFLLALPHGVAAEFALPLLKAGRRILDLSADFRLRDGRVYEEFYGHPHPNPEALADAIYGIPELYRDRIRSAQLVAAAGCYPTSILLPLVPLLRARLLDVSTIAVSSASGVTGAGRKSDVPYLFAECNESLRSYGIPKHRHLSEIEQELSVAAGETVTISFVPHLVPMNRGIHSTIFAKPSSGSTEDQIGKCLNDAYSDEPFVRVGDRLPDTKYVVGTNFCDISYRYDDRTGRLILLSAEDNLVKGAAGQAIQCLNLMSGQPEISGLLDR